MCWLFNCKNKNKDMRSLIAALASFAFVANAQETLDVDVDKLIEEIVADEDLHLCEYFERDSDANMRDGWECTDGSKCVNGFDKDG